MNRRLLTIVVLLAALAAGGFYVYRVKKAAGGAAGLTQYKLTKVEKGEVKKTVSSTGTLQPWNIVDIKARAGGELRVLAVDVGDEVKKGQFLARIDPLDVRLALNTAKADEQSAVARQKQSNMSYQLQVRQSGITIADAQANLQSAKANVAAARARLATATATSSAQPTVTRNTIASAQATYQQSVEQRKQLNSTVPQQRAAAKAAFDQATANAENARLSVERQKSLLDKGFVSQQAVDTAVANQTVTQAQVTSAKARLDTIDAELASTIDAADARVNQTRAALESAKAGTIDIANRRNAVGEATAALNQARAGEARAEVTLRQARANQLNNDIRGYDVQAAQAAIARAEASRINAQTSMERTQIVAPSNGVVLQKYVEQGTIIASALSIGAQGTNLIQIGDTSRMYVDVNVDETDIASVDVGQTVDVAIEAYPGVPFEGKVIRVDPRAQVEQNVTTIHVRVEVDNSAPTFRLLKPGMNTTCEFVIDEKEDVIQVPNEAVRDDDNGKFVEVSTGGRPAPPDATGIPADEGALVEVEKKRVSVEVGLEGNDSVEITTGLKEGDMVITQTIEPAPPAGAAGGSPFAGGGGGRGGGGGGRGGR